MLLGDGLVVDGFDGLVELVFEVGDEGGELGFELAGAGFLFGAAFGFEAGAFAGELGTRAGGGFRVRLVAAASWSWS